VLWSALAVESSSRACRNSGRRPTAPACWLRPPAGQVTDGQAVPELLVLQVAGISISGAHPERRVNVAVPLANPRQHLGEPGDQRYQPVCFPSRPRDVRSSMMVIRACACCR